MQPLSEHLFRVDRERGIPVGTQLGWHLRRLIAGGRLAPGDRLPSVRRLADVAGVHVNTVRSVYGRLEEQGYVSSEHGRGTFVARDRPATDREETLERLAAELEAGAQAAGLNPHEVVARLYGGEAREHATDPGRVDPVETAPASDGGAAARRGLRREIAALEARLVRHPAAQPAGDEARRPPRSAEGGLPSTEELTAVRNELRERLRSAEAVRAEVIDDLRRSEAAMERSPERRLGARSSASLAGVRVRFTGA